MKFSFVFALLFSYSILFAQIGTLKSPMLKVILKDSTVYYGRIISTVDNKIIFSTKSSVEISIPKESILEIYRMQDLPKEKPKSQPVIQPETPKYIDKNSHRLFSISNGDGYLTSNELFFPFVAFGFGNIFSVGGGISIVPSIESQLYYFSPKITL